MRRLLLLLLAPLWPFLGGRAQTRLDYFLMEAEKLRLAGDYAPAAELYRHCLDIDSLSPAATHNLGLVSLSLRDDSLGLSLLRRACALDTGNVWYLETLAAVLLDRRDADGASRALERMAALRPRRSDILGQLSRVYQSRGETDKALGALSRIELLEGKSAQLSLQKFELRMARGQRDSAFMELDALCREYPHDTGYKVLLGNQYQRAGDTAAALRLYREAGQADPGNESLLYSMLGYYGETGDTARFRALRDSLLFTPSVGERLKAGVMRAYIDEARADTSLRAPMLAAFDSVLAMPQRDTQLLALKAAWQVYAERPPAEVAATMRRVLEVDPGNEAALSHLLQHYASLADYRGVEDVCRAGVNHHPEELAYAYYLGVALYQQDKPGEALAAFLQGLRSRSGDASPRLVSDLYSALGDLHYQQGSPAEAFAAYDSSLVYDADNASCLNNYAYYLALRGERLDSAEEMSYRSVRAEPKNSVYLDTYAWILFAKGDYAGARAYIDRVVDPALGDAELLAADSLQGNLIEHAGDIYMMCGRGEEALRLWRLALRKGDGTCTPALPKKIRKRKYIKDNKT